MNKSGNNIKSELLPHAEGVREVLRRLNSHETKGLSPNQVEDQRAQHGPNELPSTDRSERWWVLLAGQFRNPLVAILFIALGISLLTGHRADAIIILTVILISAVVGFLQEYKANQALDKLGKLITPRARVIRDGQERQVEPADLVPGDILVLAPGDRVSADARLLESTNLEANEAALTGESVPVEKTLEPLPADTPLAERTNQVFLGTVISRGSGRAVVTATGAETELGQIARLVRGTSEEATPLQKQLIGFGKLIGIFLIFLNLLIFGLGIATGREWLDMLMISVAIVVAAVPEGLLPAMTIILAIGMQRLARKKGLVRKMLATETLGSVTVICSDKTGTLTRGEMTVTGLVTWAGGKPRHQSPDGFTEKPVRPDYLTREAQNHLPQLLMATGFLCNNSFQEGDLLVGTPTEKGLLAASLPWARAATADGPAWEEIWPRTEEIPFDSEHKFMATRHRHHDQPDQHLVLVKGAPERILDRCTHWFDSDGERPLADEQRRTILAEYEKLTATGARVLATAFARGENATPDDSTHWNPDSLSGLSFSGLIVFEDPLRPETKDTIRLCRRAGIRPLIITGDHRNTAAYIARQLDLPHGPDNLLDGRQLDKLSDEELKEKVKTVTVFARVAPHHKIRIVTALQSNGHITAMTGDGVNDAPALKKADIGVAVGSGTDVARETADLVLLDDNFSTLVEAVRRGRATFSNVRKVILYLMANSFKEVTLITMAILLGSPLPLLPAQILWIKMIEDSLPSMALAFEPVQPGTMDRPPRPREEPILNRGIRRLMLLFIPVVDLALFGIFYYYLLQGTSDAYAQTMAFAGLGVASRFYIFSVRNLERPLFRYRFWENQWVNLSTVFGLAMIVLPIYLPGLNRLLGVTPLAPADWLLLLAHGIFSVVIFELAKWLFLRRGTGRKTGKRPA